MKVAYGNAFDADYPDATEPSAVDYTVANEGSEAFWLYQATVTVDLRTEGDRFAVGYLAGKGDGLVKLSAAVDNPFETAGKRILIKPGRQYTGSTVLFGDMALGTTGGDAPVTVTVSPGEYAYQDDTLNTQCGLR